ncbi:Desiccation protectant protein Lea14 homolog [Linum perenne]
MADLFDQAKNLVSETIGSIPKPEATVTDVDLSSVKFDHIEYVARVSVDNPYPILFPSVTSPTTSKATAE